MLDTLTVEEVEDIQGLDGDKVFDILTFLSNKFERSIAKQWQDKWRKRTGNLNQSSYLQALWEPLFCHSKTRWEISATI